MDLSITLTQVIEQIQTDKCLGCNVGQALVKLKEIRDGMEAKPSQPVTQRNTAKLQRKTADLKPKTVSSNSKVCRVCEKTKSLSEFPTNKQCVGGYTRTCKACTYQRAKKSAVTRNSRTAPAPDLDPDDADDLTCKLCNSPCASPERLERHMKMVHGKVA